MSTTVFFTAMIDGTGADYAAVLAALPPAA